MKKIIVWILALGIVAGGGYYCVSRYYPSLLSFSGPGQDKKAETASGGPETSEVDATLQKTADELASAPLTEIYTSDEYGFGLKYPSELIQTEIPADESSGVGDMILFDNGFGGGFQIVVTPFDEPEADITPERIKQDVPDMTINDPQDVNLGAGRGKGTTFLDGDPKSSATNRQIWFAGNGHLYQITAMPVFDKLMQRVLATWSFR